MAGLVIQAVGFPVAVAKVELGKICDDDGLPLPAEGEVDIFTGVAYASGDFVLCEIAWTDATPSSLDEIRSLMDQPADALEDGGG